MFGLFLGLAQVVASPPIAHAQLPHPLSNYITPDDYPAAAIPSRAVGRVDLVLSIDTLGRLTACTIRKSSGSPILDEATCNILRRRLKFVPARTASGELTTDQIEASYDWHFPPPELLRHMH